MKTKLIITLLYLVTFNTQANDNFISGYGNSFSEARSGASKIAISQNMKIIGQNYYVTKDGNWVVTLKVRRFYEN